ncbi:MAG TPA: ABC transporter permease [Thermomicrobiales bacterium]|nr:ABC transporter permease [Thermomicrobiales bacterium]
MAGYILRRLTQMIPVLILTTIFVFSMLHLAPGDPVSMILNSKSRPYTQEDFDRTAHDLGMDKPLPVQYLDWVGGVLTGNFGTSIFMRRSIGPILVQRMGATALLALGALIFALPIGIGGGIFSALWRGSIWDKVINAVIVGGIAFPTFALGLFLIVLFGLEWKILPVGGMTSFGDGSLVDRLKHLVLPAVSLGVGPAAIIARLTRSAMLEVLNQDYIRTARAKGLKYSVVVREHAFRNVLVPVLTVVGLQVGFLLGGAVLVEIVFSWPGMGELIVNGIQQRDFPVVQAGVLVIATMFILINMLVDVIYAVVDPRVRYAK